MHYNFDRNRRIVGASVNIDYIDWGKLMDIEQAKKLTIVMREAMGAFPLVQEAADTIDALIAELERKTDTANDAPPSQTFRVHLAGTDPYAFLGKVFPPESKSS